MELGINMGQGPDHSLVFRRSTKVRVAEVFETSPVMTPCLPRLGGSLSQVAHGWVTTRRNGGDLRLFALASHWSRRSENGLLPRDSRLSYGSSRTRSM
jgi:hypothetical protein